MIMVKAQHGHLSEACELLHEMHESGVVPDCQMLGDLLGACAKHTAFSEGRFLHSVAILLDIDTDLLVTNALINMYGDCSSLGDAWCLFETMRERTGLILTSIIEAYAHSGNNVHAIYLYTKMHMDVVLFDKVTLLKLLNVCTMGEYLTDGQKVHIDITIRGYDLECVVANALIDMYGKCGALLNAKKVFETIINRDVVSWNIMITAYAQQNKVTEVYNSLSQMKKEGVAPDEVTYVSVLSACFWKDTLFGITLVYDCVVCGGLAEVPAIVASLIQSYAKLGMLEDAHDLFGKSLIQNVVTWNCMIMGHAEQGRPEEALQLFAQMQNEGILAEKASYVCTLNACTDINSLLCGKQLHVCIISRGFLQDMFVNTALISLYGRCSCLQDTCALFYRMPERDEVSWSAFIRALSENGSFGDALKLFERMLEEATLPNITIFLNFLHACTEHRASTDGSRLHARLLCGSFVSDIRIENAILNMYAEFGSIVDLEIKFFEMQEHDVISFNTIIKGYVRSHYLQEALQTFLQLVVEGLKPDMVTLAIVFEICGNLRAYFQGKLVHILVIYGGMSHVAVNNAAVTMYSKCGHVQEALRAFNHFPEKTVTSWNSIISVFCYWEVDRKALEMFVNMLWEVTPDAMTFVTVLCAFRNEEALTNGRLLHYFISSLGFENDTMVGNSLISMYGRCRSSSEAESVFERLSKKTTATWNAMLTSGVLQGTTNVCLIENMLRNGVRPNEITFASSLDLCVNNDNATRGRLLHMHIIFYGFELDVNIVTSLVSLYGKCGMLKDARGMFESAIIKNLFTWTAMIAAYACYGLDKQALRLLQQMENKRLMPDNVMFVSILSSCGHSGALDIGQHFLFEMLQNDMAELEHFNCLIDFFSRMGQLKEAENIIWSMPFQPTAISWTTLVGPCQTVGDVDRAHHAVAHIIELSMQKYWGF